MFQKPKLALSINPLYKCNLNCPFCYLGSLKDNQNILDLTYLINTLTKISYRYDIECIDIYGGEVSLLSEFYFDMLVKLCKTFSKNVAITTNFIDFNKPIINNFDNIGVSLDFNNFRDKQEKVYNNIKAAIESGKVINVLSLDISCQQNEEEIIKKLNELRIQSWRIIPYSKSKENKLIFKGYQFFEDTVKRFLKLQHKMKFSFINKLELDGIINNDYYNTTHFYITPNNKVALLQFENNEEYFHEFNSLDELYDELKNEQLKRDNYCKNCSIKNKCLAEHFNYEYKGESCSGMKNLIMNYKNDN